MNPILLEGWWGGWDAGRKSSASASQDPRGTFLAWALTSYRKKRKSWNISFFLPPKKLDIIYFMRFCDDDEIILDKRDVQDNVR